VWTGTGRQQLLGDGFPLHEAVGREDGFPAVLVDHHGRAGVDVGSVEHGLAELLHVPRGDGLRVGQLGGKHLHGRGRDGELGSFRIKLEGRGSPWQRYEKTRQTL